MPRYFNPRPREEGDVTHAQLALGVVISIHALVKRATVTHAQLALGVVISIHALVKRATVCVAGLCKCTIISIHALVKRATANLYNDYLYFEAKYHISDIFPQ